MESFLQGRRLAENFGARPAAAEISPASLKSLLTKPPDWGPTEWGPIPFLPSPDVLVSRMEKQWGPLDSYNGMNSTANGKLCS